MVLCFCLSYVFGQVLGDVRVEHVGQGIAVPPRAPPLPSERERDNPDLPLAAPVLPERVYLRIAADLRARIEAGEFTAGGRDGKIPSVRTLMQEHGVAYDTAQHAVTTLEAEGLVKRYPGRGYYVTSRA
jgi:hypothetical protein